MEECLAIYRTAWEDQWPEFHGEHFDFSAISVEPKPLQDRLPIYYGGTTPFGARRAVRWCDGLYPMLLNVAVRPDTFNHLIETARIEGDRLGRDMTGFEILAFTTGVVTGPDSRHARAGDDRVMLTGTAEQVLADIGALAANGYGHLTIYFEVDSGSMSEYLEILERFGEEVLPHVAEITPAPLA
jgi:alkanesulfonate monooxygenase SsuD/methylene tetrahydromethanopterin reductase-like flavin-dependent oxidoreductase (luciferase family)